MIFGTAFVRRLDIVPTVDAWKGVKLSGVAADRQIGQDGFRGGRKEGKEGREERKEREEEAHSISCLVVCLFISAQPRQTPQNEHPHTNTPILYRVGSL